MKFFWTMPNGLKYYYQKELERYKYEMLQGNLQLAWRQLERLHVISQAYYKEHTYVHYLMLRFGMTTKNRREIIGQLPRLLFGGLKSFIGVIPTGNTGGADVPPLKSMKIPEDLEFMLRPYRRLKINSYKSSKLGCRKELFL